MLNHPSRGGVASARPFHPIRSIEFSPQNTLCSASFSPPLPRHRLQVIADRLVELLMKEGKP